MVPAPASSILIHIFSIRLWKTEDSYPSEVHFEMKKPWVIAILLVAAFFAAPQVSLAQLGEQGIAWIPTWKQALAEARQTGKPILLMAGAPSCGGVPGVW
jgi:hypothetical protein